MLTRRVDQLVVAVAGLGIAPIVIGGVLHYWIFFAPSLRPHSMNLLTGWYVLMFIASPSLVGAFLGVVILGVRRHSSLLTWMIATLTLLVGAAVWIYAYLTTH